MFPLSDVTLTSSITQSGGSCTSLLVMLFFLFSFTFRGGFSVAASQGLESLKVWHGLLKSSIKGVFTRSGMPCSRFGGAAVSCTIVWSCATIEGHPSSLVPCAACSAAFVLATTAACTTSCVLAKSAKTCRRSKTQNPFGPVLPMTKSESFKHACCIVTILHTCSVRWYLHRSKLERPSTNKHACSITASLMPSG